jgi:hypothetical protein
MITFVATAYKETIDAHQFIASLILQKNPNWKCIIYCDEPNQYIKNTIEYFNDERIRYYQNEIPTKFWGHYNRLHALNNLVDTEFIIQTSIQDYYLPNTVSLISKFKNDYDFIYFNCVHNHFDYNVLDSQPIVAKIDWGSFAIRTEIAKKIGIKNLENNLTDGLFVVDCFKHEKLRYLKINRILTVHN